MRNLRKTKKRRTFTLNVERAARNEDQPKRAGGKDAKSQKKVLTTFLQGRSGGRG